MFPFDDVIMKPGFVHGLEVTEPIKWNHLPISPLERPVCRTETRRNIFRFYLFIHLFIVLFIIYLFIPLFIHYPCIDSSGYMAQNIQGTHWQPQENIDYLIPLISSYLINIVRIQENGCKKVSPCSPSVRQILLTSLVVFRTVGWWYRMISHKIVLSWRIWLSSKLTREAPSHNITQEAHLNNLLTHIFRLTCS